MPIYKSINKKNLNKPEFWVGLTIFFYSTFFKKDQKTFKLKLKNKEQQTKEKGRQILWLYTQKTQDIFKQRKFEEIRSEKKRNWIIYYFLYLLCPFKVDHTFTLQYTLLFLACGKLCQDKTLVLYYLLFPPSWQLDCVFYLLLFLSLCALLLLQAPWCYWALFTLSNNFILHGYHPPGSGTSLLSYAYLFAKEDTISLDVFFLLQPLSFKGKQ